jgi:DNA repair exonuclease SbcCD nuclease subunit
MIIVVGDPHLTDKPSERYRHHFIGSWLVDYVGKHKPDAVLILGDLTEEKDRHPAGLVNAVAEYLHNTSVFSPVLVLMGNHDYATEDVPFFDFLGRIKNIEFVRYPTRGSELRAPFAKIFSNTLLLPHTRDHARDWSGVDFDVDMVFAHNTFEGANSEHGHRLSGIPESALKGAPVLAGDVHKPQKVGGVTYLGAPYTIDYGDDYESRIAKYDAGKVRFVSTSTLPQKRLVELKATTDLIDHKDECHPGDLLKVRVPVDDMDGWKRVCDGIREDAAKMEVSVERIEPIILGKTKRKQSKVSASKAASDKEILVQFADRHRLDDATFEVGLDLLEGA